MKDSAKKSRKTRSHFTINFKIGEIFMKLIYGTTKDKFQKLLDSTGYFKRFIELKRLEK